MRTEPVTYPKRRATEPLADIERDREPVLITRPDRAVSDRVRPGPGTRLALMPCDTDSAQPSSRTRKLRPLILPARRRSSALPARARAIAT